jgi:hypothetical protein
MVDLYVSNQFPCHSKQQFDVYCGDTLRQNQLEDFLVYYDELESCISQVLMSFLILLEYWNNFQSLFKGIVQRILRGVYIILE